MFRGAGALAPAFADSAPILVAERGVTLGQTGERAQYFPNASESAPTPLLCASLAEEGDTQLTFMHER